MQKQRFRGRCKRYNPQKGFGFITLDDGSGDVFVHHSELHAQGFRAIYAGEILECEIMNQPDNKRKAINVTGPNGSFVSGKNNPFIAHSYYDNLIAANNNNNFQTNNPNINQNNSNKFRCSGCNKYHANFTLFEWSQCKHKYSKQCAISLINNIIQKYSKLPICVGMNCNEKILHKEMENLVTVKIYKQYENIYNNQIKSDFIKNDIDMKMNNNFEGFTHINNNHNNSNNNSNNVQGFNSNSNNNNSNNNQIESDAMIARIIQQEDYEFKDEQIANEMQTEMNNIDTDAQIALDLQEKLNNERLAQELQLRDYQNQNDNMEHLLMNRMGVLDNNININYNRLDMDNNDNNNGNGNDGQWRNTPLQTLNMNNMRMIGNNQNMKTCKICLTDFKIGDVVRRLPCIHYFHKNCADNWLSMPQQPRCPICRTNV